MSVKRTYTLFELNVSREEIQTFAQTSFHHIKKHTQLRLRNLRGIYFVTACLY